MEAWAARDDRIRVLRLDPNRGLPAALNAGFREARGALFTWTSDDNVLLPNALERMTSRLDDDPLVDLVYADYLAFDERGDERRVHVGRPEVLPLKNVFGCCFLYRREVHEELGRLRRGSLPRRGPRLLATGLRPLPVRGDPGGAPTAIATTRARCPNGACARRRWRRSGRSSAACRTSSRGERARVRLRWAWRLLGCGEGRSARRDLVVQALRDAPLACLRPLHVAHPRDRDLSARASRTGCGRCDARRSRRPSCCCSICWAASPATT